MKKTVSIIILILISFFMIIFPSFVFAEKWHPINKKLRMMYPADDMPWKWPAVPRVMPEYALQLYRSGKAVFIVIGSGAGEVLGAIRMKENQAWAMDVAKLKKYAGDKLIITY